ncbi:hypothetical protein M2451_000795 [Dysgonomonas sp. PFB1-18]|uniref:hypothetical protein n=1 Tax=unclassified Dysgonomonas TaxID=2630389 RepID=UPI002476BFC2|nr:MULTISPECIES: hypothetical protein [unclassified Dysgonomonas]MDH6308484.1 hypothetical protein [Dysgonomonas sp. PF1-14]MDH6337985.1 hypothetical protein [Dysgonomonas sp. PF1-16]MDH6379482.1 hypothetical protein [Dysgonomonas sp. PFB1-18]MDH6396813.1 hypothetical protein [Dysgonomonas sp. PF1-23]
MGANRDSYTLIKDTFLKAIDALAKDYKGSSLTDIFITVDKESGEVSFYDDEENKVAEIVVFDWIDKVDELSEKQVISVLTEVTEYLDNEDKFSSLELYKPFSVNYADDNFVVIEELLLINDDSIVKLDNDLMEKFDREFDEFLDRLLKE